MSGLTNRQRLLPSLAFVLGTSTLAWGLAEAYEHYCVQHQEEEDRKQRRRRELGLDAHKRQMPASGVTVCSLIGANAAIFLAWRLPPLWRLLNRYFISVPLAPHAPAMLGTAFSHQSFTHLAVNMGLLAMLGSRVHENPAVGGRPEFLALYVTAAGVSSFVSLAAHVGMGRLAVSSLGASGAVAGVVAAWCMLHSR